METPRSALLPSWFVWMEDSTLQAAQAPVTQGNNPVLFNQKWFGGLLFF